MKNRPGLPPGKMLVVRFFLLGIRPKWLRILRQTRYQRHGYPPNRCGRLDKLTKLASRGGLLVLALSGRPDCHMLCLTLAWAFAIEIGPQTGVRCPAHPPPGRSAAWLARLLWEQEVPSSNLGAPTYLQNSSSCSFAMSCLSFGYSGLHKSVAFLNTAAGGRLFRSCHRNCRTSRCFLSEFTEPLANSAYSLRLTTIIITSRGDIECSLIPANPPE